MASTNPKVKEKERSDFKEFVGQYEQFKLLQSVNYFRKVYKDTMSEGKAILEFTNPEATEEVSSLYNEINQLLSQAEQVI